MKDRYLEVTFRMGKPLAAYLYLPRAAGVKSTRTREMAPGLLVDYAQDDTPIGIEIVAPDRISLEQLNEILDRLGQARLTSAELAPLRAA